MRTYILDTLNRFKRFSENLDVKTILCNKSWWIFNDCGEKEIYIFQEDGSLIISISGRVIYAKWQYIITNKSLIISHDNESYMLHPAFIDEKIFALQQDGTNKFVFMIDESQFTSFMPKNLTDLKTYFEIQEHKKLQEEVNKQKLKIEQERNDFEQQKKYEEQKDYENKVEEALKRNIFYVVFNNIAVSLFYITPIISFIFFYSESNYNLIEIILISLCSGVPLYILIWVFVLLPISSHIEQKINKHNN